MQEKLRRMKMDIVKVYKTIRKFWLINPKTRFKKGNKKSRRRNKDKLRKEIREHLK